MRKLPRKLVIMDPKGRITIPWYMREKWGLKKHEEAALMLEVYPHLKNIKSIIIKKE